MYLPLCVEGSFVLNYASIDPEEIKYLFREECKELFLTFGCHNDDEINCTKKCNSTNQNKFKKFVNNFGKVYNVRCSIL